MKYFKLFLICLYLKALDLLSTIIAVYYYGGKETNELVNYFPNLETFLLTSFIIVSLACYIELRYLEWISKRNMEHEKFFIYCFLILILFPLVITPIFNILGIMGIMPLIN